MAVSTHWVHIDTDVDVEVDVDMAVSVNWGSFRGGLEVRIGQV